jgi:hypothetical protein
MIDGCERPLAEERGPAVLSPDAPGRLAHAHEDDGGTEHEVDPREFVIREVPTLPLEKVHVLTMLRTGRSG